MNFNAPLFLYYFLPLWALVYFAVPRSARNAVALAFSLLFYAWGAPQFVFIVFASAVVDWMLVREMVAAASEQHRRRLLVLAVAVNVAILVVAKYANFTVANLSLAARAFDLGALTWTDLALPIGVSFIVFEKITFVVDVYRRVTPQVPRLFDYLLYVFLFPKILAGPIIRYHLIAPQLSDRRATVVDCAHGLARFAFGLAKKVLIADALAPTADAAFAADPGTRGAAQAWIGLAAFTLQIYFDFSGYSDMALGLLRMMGFRLPENFNKPYIARSFTEFWRRWHISLSAWIRDYLYIPLGGNRVAPARQYVNLWICFLISGLWHGANWTFLLWGAYHGAMLIADRLFYLRVQAHLPAALAIAVNLVLVMLGWVLFRAASFEAAVAYYGDLFSGDWRLPPITPSVWLVLAIGSALCLLPALPGFARLAERFRASFAGDQLTFAAAAGLLVISLSRVFAVDFVPFFYFRF